MGAMLVWLVVVLAVAAVVLWSAVVVARGAGTGGGFGLPAFWRDFRAGLRGGGPLADPDPPTETTIDEFFAATRTSAPAYVEADELADLLQRVREQASRPLHRVHGPQGPQGPRV